MHRNFYVDDVLTSLPSKEEAIDLLPRTKDALMTLGKIRLHKFVSNDVEVMKNLHSEDLAKDLKEINLYSESLPVQRSLGLYWDLETDSFIFHVSLRIHLLHVEAYYQQ